MNERTDGTTKKNDAEYSACSRSPTNDAQEIDFILVPRMRLKNRQQPSTAARTMATVTVFQSN